MVWKKIHDAVSRETTKGREYLPDLKISKKLKEKIGKIPFIQNLAEKVDTFVSYRTKKNPDYKKHNLNKFETNIAIKWEDAQGGHSKYAYGGSDSSLNDAVNELLEKVTEERFAINDLNVYLLVLFPMVIKNLIRIQRLKMKKKHHL